MCLLAEFFLDCKENTFRFRPLLSIHLSLSLPLGSLSRVLGHLLPHLVRFQGDLVLQGRGVVGLLDGVSLIWIGRKNAKTDGNLGKAGLGGNQKQSTWDGWYLHYLTLPKFTKKNALKLNEARAAKLRLNTSKQKAKHAVV